MRTILQKYFKLFLVTIIIIQIHSISFAIVPNNSENLDPVLINGTKYSFFPANIDGHQYLVSHEHSTGKVTISGKEYNQILLNYDIYNQTLVLKFASKEGSMQMISMSDAWISSFSLYGKNFEFREIEDGSKKIFQVIGENELKVLYYWKKHMKLNASTGKYYFTNPIKENYLFINNNLMQYKGNRSFIKLFAKKHQKLIKNYIKNEKIRVSKLNDSQVINLINKCNIICEN